MHHDVFPGPYDAKVRAEYQRPGSSSDFDRGRVNRRAVLAALGFVAIGAAATGGGAWLLTPGGESPTTAAPRGSLEWALSLETAARGELIHAAGDLERVSVRHERDPRLVPLFERLVDTVLSERHEAGDLAVACALRGLERHGRRDLALRRAREIIRRPDLRQSTMLVNEMLAEAREGR